MADEFFNFWKIISEPIQYKKNKGIFTFHVSIDWGSSSELSIEMEK